MLIDETVRNNTSIPVPRVLDWSDDRENDVGAEYIIMEAAGGVPLQQRWETMDAHQHMLVVKELGTMCKDIAALQCPAYGSLYYNDAQLPDQRLVLLDLTFCIGPNCGSMYWQSTPGDSITGDLASLDHGPWHTHEKYIRAQVDGGLARIPIADPQSVPRWQGTVEQHVHLNSQARKVLLQLERDGVFREVQTLTLLHHDLHKRNIFVSETDPTKVTRIIDWQASSVQPSWTYAEDIPDFYLPSKADYDGGDLRTVADQSAIEDVSRCE